MAKQRWACPKCKRGLWLYGAPSEPPRCKCKPNVNRSYTMEKILEAVPTQ